MKSILMITITIVYTLCNLELVYAKDETIKEKAQEISNDSKRATKKTARKIEDKTCSMVNGKMKCVAKKVKHSLQNTGDSIQDAID